MRVTSLLTRFGAAVAAVVLVSTAFSGTAAAGTSATKCKYDDQGGLLGCGHFINDGDILRACDYRADGRRVIAQLKWNGEIRARVSDREAGTCDDVNLDIAEGTPVHLRICVGALPCTAWEDGVA